MLPPRSSELAGVTPTDPGRSTSAEPTFRAARVTFTHFTVEVRDARLTEAHGLLVRVRVCVRRLPPDPPGDRTRISWDPWSVTMTSGAPQRPRLFDASHPPDGLFPADRTYRVGQCARGWIPFAGVSRVEQVKAVDYRNGVGDRTTWKRSSLPVTLLDPTSRSGRPTAWSVPSAGDPDSGTARCRADAASPRSPESPSAETVKNRYGRA